MRVMRVFFPLVSMFLSLSGWSQESILGPLDPLRFPQLKNFSAHRSSSNNPDLNSNDDSKRPIPGESIVLADLQGPGIVTHIWLTVAASEYGWPRLLRLHIFYDGSPQPSVDCPVGDFFAVGHGLERPVNSTVVRNSSSGRSRNSYWPMPFRHSCRITITNEGRRRVSNLYYHVDWQKVPSLPSSTAYFHAHYRQALPAEAGKPYEVLRVQGQGHYVGTVLSVIQTEPGWFGEGDDYFYVDGEKRASIEGTGTEDYFNDAWSLRVAEGPYAGVPVADGTGVGARMSAYRWHLVDPVPFTRSLRFELEHKGWTYNRDGSVRSAFEERPDLFSSVAFWYQLGIAQDLPEPPYGAARLPLGNARQIEAENYLNEAATEGGEASVQREVFWSKDLLFFKAQGPGSKISIPLEVEEDGQYEIVAQLAHSPDYGNYTVQLDGKPASSSPELEHEPGANVGSAEEMVLYYPETYVAEDHLIGWGRLKKGCHTATFVCTGKSPQSAAYYLGIDALILAKIPSEKGSDEIRLSAASDRPSAIRRIGYLGAAGGTQIATVIQALSATEDEVREAAAWTCTQLGTMASPAVKELIGRLSDSDPVVRGLAALALKNTGPGASSALDVLIGRLQDKDENVRLMAAVAIGQQGASAARAVSALVEACKVRNEHVHVLRSLAAALGEIGPQAVPALPVLQELAKIPRVRWAAEAAIRDINRKP